MPLGARTATLVISNALPSVINMNSTSSANIVGASRTIRKIRQSTDTDVDEVCHFTSLWDRCQNIRLAELSTRQGDGFSRLLSDIVGCCAKNVVGGSPRCKQHLRDKRRLTFWPCEVG